MSGKVHSILTAAMYVLFVMFLVTLCVGVVLMAEVIWRYGKSKTIEAQAAAITALSVVGLAEILMVLTGFLGFITGRRDRKARKEALRKMLATQPESEQQAIEYQEQLRKKRATKP